MGPRGDIGVLSSAGEESAVGAQGLSGVAREHLTTRWHRVKPPCGWRGQPLEQPPEQGGLSSSRRELGRDHFDQSGRSTQPSLSQPRSRLPGPAPLVARTAEPLRTPQPFFKTLWAAQRPKLTPAPPSGLPGAACWQWAAASPPAAAWPPQAFGRALPPSPTPVTASQSAASSLRCWSGAAARATAAAAATAQTLARRRSACLCCSSASAPASR